MRRGRGGMGGVYSLHGGLICISNIYNLRNEAFLGGPAHRSEGYTGALAWLHKTPANLDRNETARAIAKRINPLRLRSG